METTLKPAVSVIIPMCDVEAYLPECLDSVINQTLRELEIILIDDGSPDRCGEIADQYAAKDARISVVHQDNHGVGHARNAGLSRASGEFVYILDSDDWLAPDALEKMYRKAVDSGTDIVMINYRHVYPENNTEKYRMTDAPPPPWLRFAGCGAWLRLIRRDFLGDYPELRFPEDIWTGQDHIFSLLLDFFTDKLVWLGEPLLFRRHRPGSKQQSFRQQREKVLTSNSNALAFWHDFCRRHPDLMRQHASDLIAIIGNLLTYTTLPLWFRIRQVFRYRRFFRELDDTGKADWRRTPRVWWFWKFGVYVPPTHCRSLLAKLSGQQLSLADMTDKKRD